MNATHRSVSNVREKEVVGTADVTGHGRDTIDVDVVREPARRSGHKTKKTPGAKPGVELSVGGKNASSNNAVLSTCVKFGYNSERQLLAHR